MLLPHEHFRVVFDDVPWQQGAPGMRFKSSTLASTRVRLVEFTSEFEEQGYCSSAHFGMVLEGALEVAYDGGALLYRAGDGLRIPAGTEARHRASVQEGGRALLILVEPMVRET